MRIVLVASLAEAVPSKLHGGTEHVGPGWRKSLLKDAGVLCLPVRSPILEEELAVCSPQSLGRAGCRAGALSGVAFAAERALDIEKCVY
jgi:hypothetical protein